ncbi:28S ribosomal protein S36, mitochondrial-like isoform X1 [Anguilla anguilla]|uniref:28S ribosomal protein S36, mitochondrial-like isoform X1 n=1 Tax=Anguilla anguilla TaxID=7936 RepID=UPI0015AFA3B1|nr:28S ribosomal protein S36, mitochondrial-like isoform X1 [Anguilla anguilla]
MYSQHYKQPSHGINAVRPHSPLIKFPNRLGVPRPNVQEALMMAAAAQSSGTHSLRPPAAPMAAPPRPLSTAPPSRVAGPPDTAASVASLPPRYRRKPLAAEEMDYIQRGGPE